MTPSSPDTTRARGPARPAGARTPEDAPREPRRLAARRLAGLAAVLAGLCWLVKSVAVLAGASQPVFVFEFAPAFQSLAVAALALAFPAGAICRTVAVLALLAGMATAGLAVLMPEHVAVNVAILAATLLVLAALFLVGGVVRRQQVLGRWSRLPRRLAFWTVPLVLAGGLLSALNERLLEVPLLVLGLGWLWLGGLLSAPRVRPRKARPTRRPRQNTNGARQGRPR